MKEAPRVSLADFPHFGSWQVASQQQPFSWPLFLFLQSLELRLDYIPALLSPDSMSESPGEHFKNIIPGSFPDQWNQTTWSWTQLSLISSSSSLNIHAENHILKMKCVTSAQHWAQQLKMETFSGVLSFFPSMGSSWAPLPNTSWVGAWACVSHHPFIMLLKDKSHRFSPRPEMRFLDAWLADAQVGNCCPQTHS